MFIKSLFSSRTTIRILIIAMLASAIITAISIYTLTQTASFHSRYLTLAQELNRVIQTITTTAPQASAGQAGAFSHLTALHHDANSIIAVLQHGTPTLPPLLTVSPKLYSELLSITTPWNQMRVALHTLDEDRRHVLAFHQAIQQLGTRTSALPMEYNSVVLGLLNDRAPLEWVILAQQQVGLAGRISAVVDRLSNDPYTVQQAEPINMDSLMADIKQLYDALGTLLSATTDHKDTTMSQAAHHLSVVSTQLDDINQILHSLALTLPHQRNAYQAVEQLELAANPFIIAIHSLTTQLYKPWHASRALWVGITLLWVSLLLISLWQLGQARIRSRQTSSRAGIQQQAVQQLLDELAYIDAGDLSYQLTVTEGFTGSIATSINAITRHLSQCLCAIKDVARQLSVHQQHVQQQFDQLANQTQLITSDAVALTHDIAHAMQYNHTTVNQWTDLAEQCAQATRNASDIMQHIHHAFAQLGDHIRHTTEDITLWEQASQAIHDHIASLNDRTEQTHIVLLNAAIQAAKAESAIDQPTHTAHDFTVVIDDTQHLMEQSAKLSAQSDELLTALASAASATAYQVKQANDQLIESVQSTEPVEATLNDSEHQLQHWQTSIQDYANTTQQHVATAQSLADTMKLWQTRSEKNLTVARQTITHIEQAIDQLNGKLAVLQCPANADTNTQKPV